jgi:taurine dioxygenase
MTIEVVPVTGTVGAEVRGVDPSVPFDPATVAAVRDALLRHLVVTFRDVTITPQQQIAFAAQFGEIQRPPLPTKFTEWPEINVLDQTSGKGDADRFHNDNTYTAEPPMGSVLHIVRAPSAGGDTCFANMYAAYDALSPTIQAMLEPLRATHDLSRMLRKAIANGQAKDDLDSMQERWPPVTHPVIRTNTETGRKSLFINGQWAVFIEGLTERENAVLLPFLCDHVRSPEFQCRFQWRPNSIAFWDNRWVQHYGVADYTERRVMQRVTIEGERPV